MLHKDKKSEYRCKKCNKLLAKIVLKEYAGLYNEIEIKCPRCEYINLVAMIDLL
jgi:phage FluMu protein Com